MLYMELFASRKELERAASSRGLPVGLNARFWRGLENDDFQDETSCAILRRMEQAEWDPCQKYALRTPWGRYCATDLRPITRAVLALARDSRQGKTSFGLLDSLLAFWDRRNLEIATSFWAEMARIDQDVILAETAWSAKWFLVEAHPELPVCLIVQGKQYRCPPGDLPLCWKETWGMTFQEKIARLCQVLEQRLEKERRPFAPKNRPLSTEERDECPPGWQVWDHAAARPVYANGELVWVWQKRYPDLWVLDRLSNGSFRLEMPGSRARYPARCEFLSWLTPLPDGVVERWALAAETLPDCEDSVCLGFYFSCDTRTVILCEKYEACRRFLDALKYADSTEIEAESEEDE